VRSRHCLSRNWSLSGRILGLRNGPVGVESGFVGVEEVGPGRYFVGLVEEGSVGDLWGRVVSDVYCFDTVVVVVVVVGEAEVEDRLGSVVAGVYWRMCLCRRCRSVVADIVAQVAGIEAVLAEVVVGKRVVDDCPVALELCLYNTPLLPCSFLLFLLYARIR
jgi:hypothetical protein